jgi:thiosulfate/3-mercaptopyruvate sulfurtransferase
MSPIIQASDLLALYASKNLVIIDASNGKNAKTNYQENHLVGALYVDLNTQLADIKIDVSNGGRHPLPNIKVFADTISKLGIYKKSHVVVYDDQNGTNAAARFWWMLQSIGHETVQVLDGGFNAAQKIGYPIHSKVEVPNDIEPYLAEKWELPLSNITEVEEASKNKNYLIVDVRDSERFNGEKETIDLIAGHIPNAINVPFSENLDKNGLFLPSAELKKKYATIFGETNPENIIFHCGSGVTACHSLLAIAYSGLEIPKLYVGSWSEWSRNDKIIATKNNE